MSSATITAVVAADPTSILRLTTLVTADSDDGSPVTSVAAATLAYKMVFTTIVEVTHGYLGGQYAAGNTHPPQADCQVQQAGP